MRARSFVLGLLTAAGLVNSAAASNRITVAGNDVLIDNQPFLVNGVIFDISAPVSMLKSYFNNTSSTNAYVNGRIQAYDYFFGLNDPSQGVNYSTGNDAISIMSASWGPASPQKTPLGINTLRFNLDQAALISSSPTYSGYVSEVKQAVARAEAAGYVVDLALFDERNGNAPYTPFWTENPETPLDNATTEGAALTLTSLFGTDQNVIIELLNEPFPAGQPAQSWTWWANGGTQTYPQSQWYNDVFVGVNNEIAAMRAAGSVNAIIVQGLSESFSGFQNNIVDPLNRVIYSVHPFFNSTAPTVPNWNAAFGNLAATLPVVITAWNSPPSQPWCTGATYDAPYTFLNYLNALGVGVVGYGFDVPATIVRTLNGNPTTWPASCGQPGGPGQIMQSYYSTGVVPLP